jgi:hypothetical protein
MGVGAIGLGQEEEGTETLASTYFPGTADPSRAEAIEVRPGQEVRIEVTIVTTRTYRVRGRVVGSPGNQGESHIGVIAFPANLGLFGGGMSASSAVVREGLFEISGLAPGSYNVQAFREDGRIRLMGYVPVEVTSGNVDGIVISLSAGITITGTLRFEGAAPEKRHDIWIQLSPKIGTFHEGGGGDVREDGSFVIENVFDGEYRIEMSGLAEGYYVRSARAGRQDCTDEPLEVRGGISGPLELRIAKASALVSGTVRDAQGNTVPYAGVFLIRENQAMFSRMPVRSDQGGGFRMASVPPGSYYLIAFAIEEWEEDLDSLDVFSGEVLKAKGIKVTVAETGAQTVEVSLVKLRD